MQDLSWSDRMLAYRLGLGDLKRPPACHGYANACVCPDCTEREKHPAKTPVTRQPIRQPWENAA